MAMVEFVGQTASDGGNVAANPSRLVNLFREPVEAGGRAQYVLRSVPGMAPFLDLETLLLRAMAVVEGKLYVAAGGRLFRASQTDAEDLGEIEDSADTAISSNNGLVTITAGGNYYVLDGDTISRPTMGNFDRAGSVEYLNGYTILTQLRGRQFCWSALADAETMDALNFATAEATDEDITRVMVIDGMVWLFKERSAEVWYNTEEDGADAFLRLPGGVKEIGLKDFGLICRFPGGAFLIGGDNKAYTLIGGTPQNISAPGLEAAIALHRPDKVFYYEWRGHKFLTIRFQGAPAWVYDLSTGEWHERAEGWPHRHWTACASARLDGRWIVGRDDGTLAALAGYADGDAPLYRSAVSLPLYQDGQRFTVSELEFFARIGVHDTLRDRAGLVYADDVLWAATDAGLFASAEKAREPKLMLRLSADGGMTWGKEREIRMGVTGRYDKRLMARALGQFRQAVVEIRMSDPVDAPIYSAGRIA